MCITEEEFRCERKRAIEVLEDFKKLEASFNMITVKIDAKTIRSSKRIVEGDTHRLKRRPSISVAEAKFFDLSLEEFFESFDCGEENIF